MIFTLIILRNVYSTRRNFLNLILAIITAAMDMMGGDGIDKQCRTPEIMADAAYVMLTRDSRSFTGNFAIGMVQKIENCHNTTEITYDSY